MWGSFNPRTRVGCDWCFRSGQSLWLSVSIHAPAWGATIRRCKCILTGGRFNPRTRVGCDFAFRAYNYVVNVSIHAPAWGATTLTYDDAHIPAFQSTHPRGVRRLRRIVERYHQDMFQSTHPRGVRPHAGAGRHLLRLVSIHAPAWGATMLQVTSQKRLLSFNPRTRVGCDCFHVLSSRFP